jgi:hypothetical protein
MKEPYEKGVAIHSAPSFALGTVKCLVKRKQGHRRAGYRASKSCNRGADAVICSGRQHGQKRYASFWSALRSRETPSTSGNFMHENRETSEAPEVIHTTGRREKAIAARPVCTSLRSRTAEEYR